MNCPFGDTENEHYDSPAEARAAYETGQLDRAFATLSKKVRGLDDSESPSEVAPTAQEHAALRSAEAHAILSLARKEGYGGVIDGMGLDNPEISLARFFRIADQDKLESVLNAHLDDLSKDYLSPENRFYAKNMVRLVQIARELLEVYGE